MKNYSQTKEAKEKFKSPVLDYMNRVTETDKNHVFTKDELKAATGFSERVVRVHLAKIANYYPLLSFSNSKGYRIGKFDDSSTVQDLALLYDECLHAMGELTSRVVELQARMMPLIALKEVLLAKLPPKALDNAELDDWFPFEPQE